jgi:hypothetical protein
MRLDPTATLTPEEFFSLCEVNRGPMQSVIPDEHRRKLIYLNLITDRFGGLTLTETGRLGLAARHSG